MLLTISTTYQPATDIGYLFHKHPAKVQKFDISGGKAHIFYPEATDEKCTIAMLMELDSINLVRKMHVLGGSLMLHHYVNDRPYVASSFASSALVKVFSSALNGNCTERPDLVQQKMLFEVKINMLKVRGNVELINELFEPLGYTVSYKSHVLDEKFSKWGSSNYYSLILQNQCTLQHLLSHLYVLMPVFDNEKHYYVHQADVDKLMDKAQVWLSSHPKKKFITNRYLKNQSSLTHQALERLMTKEEQNIEEQRRKLPKKKQDKKVKLHQLRLNTVLEELVKSKAKSVLDLGCGEGKLLKMLLDKKQFESILGMDISYRTLLNAKKRLNIEHLPVSLKNRITLIQGSLLYKDSRLDDFDAAALVEVIEHMDEERLSAFEKTIFQFARPKTVVITTPNGEYNVKYEMEAGAMRHDDHRFEWTRQQFKDWCETIKEQFGYEYTIQMIGDLDEQVGAPSQMVVFKV